MAFCCNSPIYIRINCRATHIKIDYLFDFPLLPPLPSLILLLLFSVSNRNFANHHIQLLIIIKKQADFILPKYLALAIIFFWGNFPCFFFARKHTQNLFHCTPNIFILHVISKIPENVIHRIYSVSRIIDTCREIYMEQFLLFCNFGRDLINFPTKCASI